MWNVTRRSLWSRKRRLLGACTAVIIGVGFLASTLILGDAIRGSYDILLARANDGTDVLVRNHTEVGAGEYTQRGTLGADLVDSLATVPGVASAVASIEGTAQIVGANGKPIGGQGPPTVASNWITDPEMNGYDIVEGRAPAADNEVVIDRGAAHKGSLHVGDTATILVPEPVPMTIVGIVSFGVEDNFGNTTYAGLTRTAAEELLLGESGKVSAVLLKAQPGLSESDLRDAVRRTLPPEAEALTGAELTSEQKADIGADFLDFFEMFLLAFAAVALLVATFSIHNTFSILVAQRTRESALLRALGASRRQVIGSVAAEALVLGIVASAIGLAAGLGLATGMAALMDAAGYGLPKAAVLGFSVTTVSIAMAVGVLITLLASVAPAIKASRIAPLAALRDVAVDRSGVSWRRAVTGLVVTAAGVTTVLKATSSEDGAVARAGLGALVTLVGMVVLGPVVARLATGTLGVPVALLRGSTGSLARRNAMRNPRRSAGTASALMIGTTVVALFAGVGSSVKASIDDVIGSSFAGDLVVEQDGFSGALLSPELAPALRELPEVAASTGLSDAPMVLDGRNEAPTAANPAELAAVLDLDVVAGSVATMRADGLALSEKYAAAHHFTIGTVVPVAFADGSTQLLNVQAIYAVRNIVGDLLIDVEVWRPHQGSGGDVAVLIDLKPGVDATAGRAAVQAVTSQYHAPDPQDAAEFRASTNAEVDQMLGIVYGMLGLAILIAVLGIGNTLSLSIHERTRELGLLRAVGQSRRRLRSTVRWESVIIAVFGTVGGLGLGTFLGWGLMRAVAAQEDMGMYRAPVTSLGVIFVLAAIAGVLAARRPARRAARLDILTAIAQA
jgi:putative ABC transport system permease protein